MRPLLGKAGGAAGPAAVQHHGERPRGLFPGVWWARVGQLCRRMTLGTSVGILPLALLSCVALGKSLGALGPQFPPVFLVGGDEAGKVHYVLLALKMVVLFENPSGYRRGRGSFTHTSGSRTCLSVKCLAERVVKGAGVGRSWQEGAGQSCLLDRSSLSIQGRSSPPRCCVRAPHRAPAHPRFCDASVSVTAGLTRQRKFHEDVAPG